MPQMRCAGRLAASWATPISPEVPLQSPVRREKRVLEIRTRLVMLIRIGQSAETLFGTNHPIWHTIVEGGLPGAFTFKNPTNLAECGILFQMQPYLIYLRARLPAAQINRSNN